MLKTQGFNLIKSDKLEYAHSLNGSGLAVDRTMTALLEYYQTDTDEVNLPKV